MRTYHGVTTRVVEKREWEDGELVEVSRNFIPDADDGTVCYYGKDVDDYEDGVIVGHEGAWRADDAGNFAGILMPADPVPGMKFPMEGAPGTAEDIGKIVAIGPRHRPGRPVRTRVLRLRLLTRAIALALLAAVAAPAAPARGEQAAGERDPETPRLTLPWTAPVPPPAPDSLPAVDVEERFEEFRREFAEEFGFEVRDPSGAPPKEKPVERFGKRLIERFEGGSLYRWYLKGEALYERLEALHGHLEAFTRWSTSGFEIDAGVESVYDGDVEVHVEREIRGFDVGLDVHDAAEGRVGLRVGGVLKGYHVHLDVSDLGQGRLSFGLRKRFD